MADYQKIGLHCIPSIFLKEWFHRPAVLPSPPRSLPCARAPEEAERQRPSHRSTAPNSQRTRTPARKSDPT